MKKNLLLVAALVGLVCSGSCGKDPEPSGGTGTIVLQSPADNAVISMENEPFITFAWTNVEGVSDYRLAVSLAPDLSSPQTLMAPSNPWQLSGSAFDALLAQVGVGIGDAVTVYWTIESASGLAQTQRRSLVVRRTLPAIVLDKPDDNASIDLNNASSVEFTWFAIDIESNYRLVLSHAPDLSSPATVAATGAYLSMSVTDLDAKLGELGIAVGERAPIYWSVRPQSNIEVADIKRNITFTRRFGPSVSAPLGAVPAVLTLDKNTPSAQAVNFSWTCNEPNATYTLVFSKSQSLTDPILVQGITTTSRAYTHEELQALFYGYGTESYRLKRYKPNNLYWTVRINGGLNTEQPGQFQLNGMKIFRDQRGADVNTYDVTVLNYNGRDVVWLAEDFRAKNYLDGTPMGYRDDAQGADQGGSPRVYAPFPSSAFFTAQNCRDVPPYIRQTAGLYYDQTVLLPNAAQIIPAGWKIPTFEEWFELHDAAVKASPTENNDRVLRDPLAYPEGIVHNTNPNYPGNYTGIIQETPEERAQYNAWNMNLKANWRYVNEGLWGFWGVWNGSSTDMYDNATDIGMVNVCYVFSSTDRAGIDPNYYLAYLASFWCDPTGGIPGQGEPCIGGCVRLIYTGDDTLD
jgi:uncharacterized protein (TIGR02145 family)